MKTIFFFFALLSSGVADAGFLVNSKCYSDTTSALVAYRAQFPFCCSGNPPTYIQEQVPSTISSGGVVTSQFNIKTITTSGSAAGSTVVSQLLTCDAELVDFGSVQDMLAILAIVFLFAFGFRVGTNMSNPKGFA